MLNNQLVQTFIDDDKIVVYLCDTESRLIGKETTKVTINQDLRLESFNMIEHNDNRPIELPEVTSNKTTIKIDAPQEYSLLHIVIENKSVNARNIQLQVTEFTNVDIIIHFENISMYEEMFEVDVKEGAIVNITCIDSSNNKQSNYLRKATVATNSQLHWSLIDLGQNEVVSESFTNLIGENAQSTSKLITVSENKLHKKHRVQINHLSKFTKSDILNHGVIKDTAIGEFYGVGFIEKGASKSEAYQESRFMALGSSAKGYVHPLLLIDEYDVLAGHAGSVGKVNDEALFYLMSRGLSSKDAQNLVIKGFLAPVLENINDPYVKEQVVQLIEGKI